MRNIVREAALALHAQGFNVCAIAAGTKAPAHPWNDPVIAPWTTERQPEEVVASLGWNWSPRSRVVNGSVHPPIERVGLICGVGGLRCIDIDACKDQQGQPRHPVPEDIYATLLDALGLPPNNSYPWGGRSASGHGWHLLVRCPDPLPQPGGVMIFDPLPVPPGAPPPFGALELRWERCQVALPRHGDQIGYHPQQLTSAPAERSLEEIMAAVRRIAAPRGESAAFVHRTPPSDGRPADERTVAAARRRRGVAAAAPAPLTVLWGADIDSLPPPISLAPGWLTLGQVALLVGPSESGKSTVAVHLACTVAQHYPVLYVAAENAAGVRNQIRAWQQVHRRPRGMIGVVPGPFHAADPSAMAALNQVAAAHGVRLIIIDTLSAALPGVDENNALEMSAVVDALNRLAAATDAAVLALHHPTKSGATYRGHSALVNNTNSLHVLTPGDGGGVVLSTERHRGERRGPVTLIIGVVTLEETHYTDPRYGAVRAPVVLPPDRRPPPAGLTRCQQALLRIMVELDGDGAVATPDLVRMVGQAAGLQERAVRREIAAAGRRGWITLVEADRRRITPAGRAALAADEAARGAGATAWLEVNPHLPPPPADGEDALYLPPPPADGAAGDRDGAAVGAPTADEDWKEEWNEC